MKRDKCLSNFNNSENKNSKGTLPLRYYELSSISHLATFLVWDSQVILAQIQIKIKGFWKWGRQLWKTAVETDASTYCMSKASCYLAAFLAWDTSLHLLVTPVHRWWGLVLVAKTHPVPTLHKNLGLPFLRSCGSLLWARSVTHCKDVAQANINWLHL